MIRLANSTHLLVGPRDRPTPSADADGGDRAQAARRLTGRCLARGEPVSGFGVRNGLSRGHSRLPARVP